MPATIAFDARKLGDFGIGTYVGGLLAALGRLDREHRYLVFVGAAGEGALPPLPENFEVVAERSQLYSLRELVTLSARLATRRATLYHATHYVLPLWLPCPAVATIHDLIHLLFPEFLPGRLALPYARLMIGQTLRRSARILAVSQTTARDLERSFEVAPGKIEVVYNGVDERFREPVGRERIAASLARHGIAAPYLLFVGNPKPHKNLDTLLRAFALATAQGLEHHILVCAGDRSGGGTRAEQLALHLGIRSRVLFLGHLPAADLPALYQGAELFVYPSLYEGFGLPVAEAMASGVPVIASTTAALAEIAGDAALLVDPLDAPGLARAIVQTLADPEERGRLAERGRRRAREFSWDRAAQHTLAVYRQVLGEPARASAEATT